MEVVEFPRNANPQRNQKVLVPPSNLKYKSSWIKYPYRKSAIFKLSKKKLCTDFQGRSVYGDNVILKGSVGKIYNQFKFSNGKASSNSKTNETMPPNSYEVNKFSIMQFPPYPRPPPLKKQKSIVSKNTEIYVQGLTDVKKKKERPSQTIKVISPPNVLNVVPSQLVQVSETSKPLRRKRRFKNPVHNEHSYINKVANSNEEFRISSIATKTFSVGSAMKPLKKKKNKQKDKKKKQDNGASNIIYKYSNREKEEYIEGEIQHYNKLTATPSKFETPSKYGWNVVEDDCKNITRTKSLFLAARSVLLQSQFEDFVQILKTFQLQMELINENYKSKTFISLETKEQYMKELIQRTMFLMSCLLKDEPDLLCLFHSVVVEGTK